MAHAVTPVTVRAVSPSSGPTSGGNLVDIFGSNFTGQVSGVFFDTTESHSWASPSSSQITAAVPPHAAGVVDVTLLTEGGPVVLSSAYTYGGPGEPTGVTAGATAGGADVTWTAPISDGGYAITSYVVYVSVAGTGVWTTYPTGGTATTYPVTGLDGSTTYTIAVRAVNVNGPGSWSNTTSVTPLASASAPTAPTSLTGTAGVGQVSLAWTAPSSDGGSAITSYDVDVSAVGTGTWSTINTGSTATSRTVTGLDSTKSYDVRVRAVNSVGSGSWSNTFNVTPLAAPTAPSRRREISWPNRAAAARSASRGPPRLPMVAQPSTTTR